MSIASLYPSINPSLLLDFANSKVLDPRITFTRTTTATYYDGVTTAKAEENLLTYSQEFDNAVWNPQNSSVTSNAVSAPDGTMTADKLVSQSAAGIYPRLRRLDALSNKTQTFSIYAKKAEWSYIAISQDGSRVVYFDLNAGTIVSSDTSTGTITSVGNGWFRCTYSYTSTVSVPQPLAIMAGNTPAYGAQTGDGTSGIYLWGAQLEDRSSLTAYTATTSQAITNYIPVLQTASAGQARFDHNPTTGESLGLLIEEARTNSLTYSAQFNNAAWSKISVTVDADSVISPDGALTGDKLIASNAAGGKVTYQTVSSGTLTATVYAKAAQFGGLVLATGVAGTFFNLTTGVVRGYYAAQPTSSTITPVGNGWYRCSITVTLSTSDSLYIGPNDNVDNTLGDNVTGNGFNGIFIWGAQLEAGSFATSYIPTTSAAATRAVDAVTMTGAAFASFNNNQQFTVICKASRWTTAFVSQESVWSVSQSSPAKVVSGLMLSGLSYRAYYESAADLTVSSAWTANTSSTFAQAYQIDNYAACANGGSVSTDSSGDFGLSVGFDTLYIGRFTSPANQFNGWVQKFAYYPQRIINAQLQALTV